MTEFTKEKLAELRAVAEAATPGPWRHWNPSTGPSHVTIGGKVAFESVQSATPFADDEAIPHWADAHHIATFSPLTVLALIAALEGLSTTNENLVAYARKAEAALEAKTAEVEGYRRHFPCDGGCSYNDGPQEECSRHGRNPRDLWDIITQLARERDEARAEVERLTPKQSDGWSTQDRQEAKQEAERRWTDDWDGCQSDFDRGGINGFILGAEWQKARETFISYKTIADRAEAALERVRATATEVADHWGDQIGTHYDGCWRQHAACLAAQTLAETGADDA